MGEALHWVIEPGGREMFSPFQFSYFQQLQFVSLATESLLQQVFLLLITMSLITKNNCGSSPAIVLPQQSAGVALPAS